MRRQGSSIYCIIWRREYPDYQKQILIWLFKITKTTSSHNAILIFIFIFIFKIYLQAVCLVTGNSLCNRVSLIHYCRVIHGCTLSLIIFAHGFTFGWTTPHCYHHSQTKVAYSFRSRTSICWNLPQHDL